MRLRFLLPLLFSATLHGQSFYPPADDPWWNTPDGLLTIASIDDTIRRFGLTGHAMPMAQAATPVPAPTQIWFPVAHENDTISIPAGTVTQYGAKAGTPWGCGTQIKPLLADAWVTPKTLGSTVTSAGLGVTDPAFCYVKELDIAETATVQTVTVNGKPVTVPALPPPVTKQSYILSSDTAKPLVLTINSDGTWTLSGGGKAVKQ